MAINRVVIEGNLTRDTDVRDLANGIKVCNFTVAVNEKRKNVETGEWEDAPVFVAAPCSASVPRSCPSTS